MSRRLLLAGSAGGFHTRDGGCGVRHDDDHLEHLRGRDLPLFERALGDESAAVRRVAVDNLVVPEAVPLLLDRFEREPDAAVQAAIVRKLSEIGGPAAADGLASIAEHTADAALRREAALWLAAVRERGAGR